MHSWRELLPEHRSVLFAAALLHDVGKPIVTQEKDGRIRSPRHAAKVPQTARTILWEDLLPARIAGELPFAGADRRSSPSSSAATELPQRWPIPGGRPSPSAKSFGWTGWRCWLRPMQPVARAENREELLDRVELFREFARESQCYTEPRRFASPHTRVLYFHGRELDPDVDSYDNTRLEVIVMCGLPGAGKDHWIAQNAPGRPVISLDAIRLRASAPEIIRAPW